MGYLAHVVAMEEISRASASVGLSYGAHSNLCVNQIRRNGTRGAEAADTCRSWSRGEHVGALAMSEPGAGSDVVGMKHAGREAAATATCSTAARCGSPTGRTPTRWWSTPRPIRTRAPRGITAFLIEKGFKGFSTAQKLDKLGHARLQHLRAGVRGLRGAGGERAGRASGSGVNVLMSGLDYERAVLAGGPLGIMQACMDVVLPYVHERKQFGQPIGEFQLMQGKLADMYTTMNAAQGLRVRGRRRPATAARPTRKDAAGAILYAAEKATWMALRGDPVPGRQRLHQRIPDRPAAARRQALRDRRRHQRDPPHADRPRAVPRECVTGAACGL